VTAPVHVTLPLPAMAVLTGASLAPGYCPACLDWWYGRGKAEPEASRVARMHDTCRGLLEAIHGAPPAVLEQVA
jgi:hypothetical protein